MFALTQIKGVGRRYSNLVCKKADVDLSKRYVSTTINYTGINLQCLEWGVEYGRRRQGSIDVDYMNNWIFLSLSATSKIWKTTRTHNTKTITTTLQHLNDSTRDFADGYW